MFGRAAEGLVFDVYFARSQMGRGAKPKETVIGLDVGK